MKNSELRGVIREAIAPVKEPVNEALVASPKSFDQNTELLSKKLKEAHYDLYKRYVESFNDVSARLDTADRRDPSSNGSQFRSLKLDEAYNTNAVYLHELYFANVSDVHSEIFADSLPYIRLQRDFGTFDDWQRDFIACAMAAREGWAICGYNLFLKRFVNTFVDLHGDGAMLGLMPVIVVDMWSHSFHRDYVSDKKTYLLGQMHELNWRVIEDRFKRADRIAEAQK